jgi:hypothetical protein
VIARDWTETAVRMQRRAELASLLGRPKEMRSYLRRRDYCARKSEEAGGRPWKAISAAVGEVQLKGEVR